MRKLVLLPWVLSVLALSCRDGCMERASDHPGPPLTIPEPERRHTPAVGSVELPNQEPAERLVEGTLVRSKEDQLTLRDAKGQEQQVELPAEVEIFAGREDISRDALEEGAWVRTWYTEVDGEKVASGVELLQPPKARKGDR
ncbi:MAG: hypothetical protein ACOZIN_16990 [Myxococcota bacterium]